MNRTIRFLSALLLGATLVANAQAATRIDELNRVVAVVDDNVVTLQELEERMQTVKLKLMSQSKGGQLPPDEVLRPQVLDRIILERLQVDRAHQLGIRVDDESVNRTIARIAADSGLSLLQFRQVLAQDGVDFAAFREEIRTEMIIARLREREVENRVKVAESEVERFLENRDRAGGERAQYRLAQILIAVPEAASPEQVRAARAKAEQVLGQLREGGDFRQLAAAHSDDQQALEGGELGWRSADQLPSLFADVVTDMGPGEVSEPLRSPSGFHLVTVLDKRGEERHMVQQAHARHILIKTDELTSDYDARTRLERLRERIRAGESFERLARTHSQDPGSSRNGGDLGWTNPGSFVPAFEEVLNGLQPGQISEPFKTEFGWHIAQLLERRKHDDTEAFQTNRAYRMLRQRKVEEETQSWLRQLRDEAYIEKRLEG